MENDTGKAELSKGRLWIILTVLLFAAALCLALIPRNNDGGEALSDYDSISEQISYTGDETDDEGELGDAPAISILGNPVELTDGEKARIAENLESVGKLCREYYLNAEKIPSTYGDTEFYISQADIDVMENALKNAGYCVINSDAVYPEYLENCGALTDFWDGVLNQRNSEISVWNIVSDGSVYCCIFQYSDGLGFCTHACGQWKSDGALDITYLEKKEILYWDMTDSGFIYQDVYQDRHWTASTLLRLRPAERELYVLTQKYIAPIGYHNVNLFLLDWDSNDFGSVCFNDLLSNMYTMKYGDYLYERDFPSETEPYPHSVIPAELFESVIFEHFDISLDKFREMSLYDSESNSYPWQDVYSENILYYPELIPEVTKVTESIDGTVTLLVNVICTDNHTDHLFEHEVTLKIEPDGSFKYLSNKITYRSDIELPSPQARIPVQRFEIDSEAIS